jgi:erythromycin esterase
MRLFVLLLPAALLAQSNLNFQNGLPGDAPPGWGVPPVLKALGYAAELRVEGCRGESRCAVLLPPAALPPDSSGTLSQTFDAAPFRGKSIRLRALVRAEGRAQMWLRVDLPNRQMGFFDDMGDRPITSPEWKTYEIDGAVAADAESISIGVMSFGPSTAWIGSVSFEAVPDPASTSEALAAKAAIEKLYSRIDAAYAKKDLDAIASLAVQDAEILIGANKIPLPSALLQIMSEMESGVSYVSKSRITDFRLMGTDAIVSVNNEATRTSKGTPQILLSANRDTWINTGGGWRLKRSELISTRAVTPPTDSASATPVIAELKQRALPLDDLASFGNAVGDARIVALGEATHGTREFFQIKRRLLEYLVREKGFTVFAIEANWPESLAVDRYIKTGEGSAKAALAGMYFWGWNTEEVLDLVEWMRSYNQSPGQHAILTFTSFDMQVAHVAGRMALDFLGRYSPDDAQRAGELFTEAQMLENKRTQMFDEQAKGLSDRAAAIVHLFDVNRAAWIAASSPEAWRDARQAATVVYQSCTMRIPGKGPAYRAEANAANVGWLRQVYAGQKIVLWGHNSHVSFGGEGERSLGSLLRERLGNQLYVVGFGFRRGSVRAIGLLQGKVTALSTYDVPPSPDGSGDAILSGAGLPAFFLNFAGVPAGSALSSWLSGPHLFYNFSSNWVQDDAAANLETEILSKSFDGLIFVEEGHAARPFEN